MVQCSCQQNFEVETFLHSFVNKYASLRELNLVDYDLQLVQVRKSHALYFSISFSCSLLETIIV